MNPQFRPRNGAQGGGQGGGQGGPGGGQGGPRRRRSGGGGGREGLPKTDAADFENLPEIDFNHFDAMTPAALLKEAKAAKLDPKKMLRHELIEALLEKAHPEALYARGIMEAIQDFGFLRRDNYLPSNSDVFVSQSQIKRYNLRPGDTVYGLIRAPKEGEKYAGMLRVESVNTFATGSAEMTKRKNFDELTPLFPVERLKMETVPDKVPERIIDIISPIGKGQRGLVVSPPKVGKTTMMKAIANSIAANHPEVYLMVLLVDERPEEVTDMKRSVRGQVISSTFDEPPENHMRVAEMCLEQAKRLVETGQDVCILLDSLTRLSRASNLTCNSSGRTMSGGLDPVALHRPRRFFGAARKIEEGGSLTIIASILVETNSKMDEAIFEELKGTGNMELILDRDLAERRIWPAIDVKRSSTRKEELLFRKEDMEGIVQLRRLLANQKDSVEATDSLIKLVKRTPTNEAFLEGVVARMKATV